MADPTQLDMIAAVRNAIRDAEARSRTLFRQYPETSLYTNALTNVVALRAVLRRLEAPEVP